jgi:hypothetical protein
MAGFGAASLIERLPACSQSAGMQPGAFPCRAFALSSKSELDEMSRTLSFAGYMILVVGV